MSAQDCASPLRTDFNTTSTQPQLLYKYIISHQPCLEQHKPCPSLRWPSVSLPRAPCANNTTLWSCACLCMDLVLERGSQEQHGIGTQILITQYQELLLLKWYAIYNKILNHTLRR